MAGALTWSVVLTTHNRSALLKRAIESCIAQTAPCEIVVVDDCSTDDTEAMVGRFPQVTYIRNATNLGHSRTANIGIARASGSWIKHLDDDDYLHPDCLRRMGEVIAGAQACGYDPRIASCVSVNVDIDMNPLSQTTSLPIAKPALIERKDIIRIMMLDQAPLGTPVQVAHERETGLRVGGWNEARPIKFQNGDEAEFWIRVAPQGDTIMIPETLAYRTLWSGNEAPSHLDRLHISRYLKGRVQEQMGEQSGAQPDAEAPADIVRYLDLHWGLVALKDGNLSTALKLLPRGMLHPKSYSLIWRRRRFADAMQCAIALD
jgi:glycosyltransferase involved in cell wall biosynthesis